KNVGPPAEKSHRRNLSLTWCPIVDNDAVFRASSGPGGAMFLRLHCIRCNHPEHRPQNTPGSTNPSHSRRWFPAAQKRVHTGGTEPLCILGPSTVVCR